MLGLFDGLLLGLADGLEDLDGLGDCEGLADVLLLGLGLGLGLELADGLADALWLAELLALADEALRCPPLSSAAAVVAVVPRVHGDPAS